MNDVLENFETDHESTQSGALEGTRSEKPPMIMALIHYFTILRPGPGIRGIESRAVGKLCRNCHPAGSIETEARDSYIGQRE